MERAPIIHPKKKKPSSSSSSSKRMNETPIDRLSDLPDSLLIRILSRLDLKDAAVTSALSRRWQFLWADLPELEFRWRRRGSSSFEEQLRRFVGWVTRTLLICSSSGNNQLHKFLVNFWYQKCFASDVNLWVGFAVRNKVKHVELLLDSFGEASYVLPQIIYANSALTRLSLRGCVVAPRRTVEWGSLTSLHLKNVELLDRDVEEILSGCPVLRELVLVECSGFTRLDVNNPSLRSLTIVNEHPDGGESVMEISAPYIHFLKISLEPSTREWRLTNISSLVKADVEFEIFDFYCIDVEVMGYAQQLFGSLQHVEELELGCRCIEVISTIAEKGGWKLPLSKRRDLIINASNYTYSIHGILFLLESSPLLERLIITGKPFEDWGDLDPDVFKKSDFSFRLLHLKTIYITKFIDFPCQDGEPLLTMVKILLARASVLRKMVIDLGDFPKNFHPSDSSSEYVKITQTLLSYPRASTKAVVLLQD